jgi:hypothetical protein
VKRRFLFSLSSDLHNGMRSRNRISVELGRLPRKGFQRWAKRHCVPFSRLVRRVLTLADWTHDRKIHVVLSIDKRLKGEALSEALDEALAMVKERLA